jgi:hypothetical protein
MIEYWNTLSEGWKIFFVATIISIVTAIVRYLIKPNRDFFKLLNEFHKKLPPRYKGAKESLDTLPLMKHVDTTNMKLNLTTQEIDTFYKELEIFNYNRVFFKRKEIQSYSNNIQRIIRTSRWEKFAISIIQSLLEDESYQRNRPYLFGVRIGKVIGF